jgi:hypothetical protein
MADAARRWLDDLEPTQRALASFPFETHERRVWDYRPGPRRGLALGEMTEDQTSRVRGLLEAGLSQRGAAEVRAIIALEPVLGEIERLAGRRDWTRRDPGLSWVAVFGQPGGRSPWSWRIGGHHVAVQLTVVGGSQVAAAPLFLGANPARVRHAHGTGRRTLAAEEELARDLLARLSAAQKAIAIVDAVAPSDLLTGNDRSVRPDVVPLGLPYADLRAEQRTALERVVHQYLGRASREVATAEWKRIEAAGLEHLTFAWAGSEARGRGHYYAVRGPRCLIEYDNTQDGANHIHSVWRDPTNDWGEDLLAAHYAASHPARRH